MKGNGNYMHTIKTDIIWSISIVIAESVLLNVHDFEKKCINFAFFGSCKYLQAHNTILQHNIWLLTLFDIPLMQINRWKNKLNSKIPRKFTFLLHCANSLEYFYIIFNGFSNFKLKTQNIRLITILFMAKLTFQFNGKTENNLKLLLLVLGVFLSQFEYWFLKIYFKISAYTFGWSFDLAPI